IKYRIQTSYFKLTIRKRPAGAAELQLLHPLLLHLDQILGQTEMLERLRVFVPLQYIQHKQTCMVPLRNMVKATPTLHLAPSFSSSLVFKATDTETARLKEAHSGTGL
ncbi:hypothetical protein PO909_013780, partial [Leuciscus waleckii]